MGILKEIYMFRKTLILILTPLLLSPLLIIPYPEDFTQAACAYSILLMAVYWVSEVVPLAVTALLPLVLYPFFGILPAKLVSVEYLKDVNVLFLGGLSVAVAVEHWNLHKRIALKVLTFVGTKPQWLLFGFMSTTAFLSMWISNVATTAMMIPIAQAVLEEMNMENGGSDSDSGCSNTPVREDSPERQPKDNPGALGTPLIVEMGNIGQARELGERLASHSQGDPPLWNHTPSGLSAEGSVRFSKGAVYNPVLDNDVKNTPSDLHSQTQVTITEEGPDSSTAQLVEPNYMDEKELDNIKAKEKTQQGMSKALTICICYAANIGGTATLTGTGPNLIMAGQFKSTYTEAPEIDFGSWAMFAFPGMVIFLILAWMWLQYLFLDMRCTEIIICCRKRVRSVEEIKAEKVIRRQYMELGPMCFAEKLVLTLFILLALLWLTRDPGFIHGWGNLPIFKSRYITDASVAMLITFLLFICPSKRPNILCWRNSSPNGQGPVPPLLTWAVLQQKMAWNVIILLGGSFAMALGSKASGLSAWIGSKLEPLNGMPPTAAALICCLVICALTQCTSNTATATVFIPILAKLSEVLKVNPLYLLLPSTVITSYAFMLPVSTPPNAIAYSYGYLKMKDMVKAGFVLNIFGIAIALISVHVMGGASFNVFEPCPEWLHSGFCEEIRLNSTNLTTATAVYENITTSMISS